MMRSVLMTLTASAVLCAMLGGCKQDEPPAAPAVSMNQPPAATPDAPPPESATQPSAPGKETTVQPAPAVPTPPRPDLPPVTSSAGSQDPTVAVFAGLTGPKPATWIWHPPQRQFSVAEYAVPGSEGADQARLDVFKAGGSLQANIDRWKGQFRGVDGAPVEPKVQELTVNDMKIAIVEFAGAYRGMGSVSFVPDQLFLCAVVEAIPEQVFIRLAGPAKTVETNRAAFMTLIQNLKRVDPEK